MNTLFFLQAVIKALADNSSLKEIRLANQVRLSIAHTVKLISYSFNMNSWLLPSYFLGPPTCTYILHVWTTINELIIQIIS